MTFKIPTPSKQPTRSLIALTRMELASSPTQWPLSELGAMGFAAAALITDRVDLLPDEIADPGVAWGMLPSPFRAVVEQRNPAMAAYCQEASLASEREM
jgi:hypothetical protein